MRPGYGKWAPVLWLLSLITALLLVPLPYIPAARLAPALADELENLGHPLAFGLLAWLAFDPWRRRLRSSSASAAWLLLLALAGFGAATELLQLATGRDATWGDWLGDASGAGAVIFWKWARVGRDAASPSTRRLLMLAGLCLAAAIAPLTFTLTAYSARAAAWPVIWRADSLLLQRFAAAQTGRYPGLALDEPRADWSGFRSLVVVVRNLREAQTSLHVRVHDRQHNKIYADRFNRKFLLPPASVTTLHIALADIRDAPIGRKLDLSAISAVIFFTEEPGSMPFRVETVRLDNASHIVDVATATGAH